jgi:hypothetical protein
MRRIRLSVIAVVISLLLLLGCNSSPKHNVMLRRGGDLSKSRGIVRVHSALRDPTRPCSRSRCQFTTNPPTGAG